MDQTLRLYLHQPLLTTARAGKLGVANRLAAALHSVGWRLNVLALTRAAMVQAPDLPGWALYHMAKPTHDRALTMRLAYHYPFWRIETVAERWRWPVALARFRPGAMDGPAARDFAARLARRVLPGPAPKRGDHVLIPLQGQIRRQRSFQTMAPVDMLATVAQSGRPCVATLHPREDYDAEDHAALSALAARHPNLTIGGNTADLLRNCAFVATMNSAVAFDGLILGKPAVLFAQVDFHHIALNTADLGVAQALDRAADHRPPFARYLDWFLRRQSLDMMADDVQARILSALRRGGVPIG
ncbi:MAG: hypothetical protein Q4G22_10960 [Paracoccus sp. (in: a-proteobacteria)]|uniref:hypothetical protein n=1 Tax=Paracoccus sp. TaxID=267 RepID=UPI0026DF7944|nr:hypothetical protein [Paracoccus sp. (in: a-proteobacteria)]MDO5632345.1 hypothetical protein [Paracoccus sp. (in: a-proteobacteria)]